MYPHFFVKILIFSIFKHKKDIPWIKLFTSLPLISIYISNFACTWGNFFFITKLPAYVENVLKFNIKDVGINLSYPFFGAAILIMIASTAGDKLLEYEKIKKLTVRKVFNSIGLFIPMICLIALIFVSKIIQYGSISLLVIAISFRYV